MSLNKSFEISASPQYEFHRIGHEGHADVLMLWNKAKSALDKDKEHHLKPLNRENLFCHASSGYPVVGMVDITRNRLVAVLLLTPGSAAMNEGYTPSSVTEMPAHWQNDACAVIQCVAVDPDYKKQGLGKSLLAFSETLAGRFGIAQLFAKVAHDNLPSQAAFWKSDYMPILETTGKYEDREYAASYFNRKVCAEPIALQDIPLFNGCHVNDNETALGQQSFNPV